jgi:protoporphyrin/coproporphyrin ferrochelatase
MDTTINTPETIGILLCNVGTPDEPTSAAVRRFLAEFLSDPRVVDLPRLLWLPILYLIVLTFRPRKSALKYASIWLPEGSPLLVWQRRQAEKLEYSLRQHGVEACVRVGMRYGSSGIAEQLDAFEQQGIRKIVVLPNYPQYSLSTTASVMDVVDRWKSTHLFDPVIHTVDYFYDNPIYIRALGNKIERYWAQHGRSTTLVFSFHSLPQRFIDRGDPYQTHCYETALLLADQLGLSEAEYCVTFQSQESRIGWLQPTTAQHLRNLAIQQISRVDVVCPGFTCDCLESLEDIDRVERQNFLAAGAPNATFHYIPCLNDDDEGIEALRQLTIKTLTQ